MRAGRGTDWSRSTVPVDHKEDLGFRLEGGGSPGSLWAEGEVGPDFSAHKCPLATVEGTDCEG